MSNLALHDPPKRDPRIVRSDARNDIASAFAPVLAFAGKVEDPTMDGPYAPEIAESVAAAAIHARNSLIEKEPKKEDEPTETLYHRAQAILSAIANAAIQTTHDELLVVGGVPREDWLVQIRPSRTEARMDLMRLCEIAEEFFLTPEKEDSDD